MSCTLLAVCVKVPGYTMFPDRFSAPWLFWFDWNVCCCYLFCFAFFQSHGVLFVKFWHEDLYHLVSKFTWECSLTRLLGWWPSWQKYFWYGYGILPLLCQLSLLTFHVMGRVFFSPRFSFHCCCYYHVHDLFLDA